MSQSTDLVTAGSGLHSRRDVAAVYHLHRKRTVCGATQPSVQGRSNALPAASDRGMKQNSNFQPAQKFQKHWRLSSARRPTDGHTRLQWQLDTVHPFAIVRTQTKEYRSNTTLSFVSARIDLLSGY